MPKLNLMRLATSSTGNPFSVRAASHSFPQAKANPNSWVMYEPALLSMTASTIKTR